MNTLTSTVEEIAGQKTMAIPGQKIVAIAIAQWNESEFPVSIFPTPPLSLIALAASRVASSRARIFSQCPSISVR